jgi:hypothetical protein
MTDLLKRIARRSGRPNVHPEERKALLNVNIYAAQVDEITRLADERDLPVSTMMRDVVRAGLEAIRG